VGNEEADELAKGGALDANPLATDPPLLPSSSSRKELVQGWISRNLAEQMGGQKRLSANQTLVCSHE